MPFSRTLAAPGLVCCLLAGQPALAQSAPPTPRQAQQIAALNAIGPPLKRMIHTSRSSLVPGASDKTLALDLLAVLQDEAKGAQSGDFDTMIGNLQTDVAKIGVDAKRVKTHAFDKDLAIIRAALAHAPGPKGQ